MRKLLAKLFLLMISSIAFTCGESYGAIQNTLDEPVWLEIEWSDGITTSEEFPPGSTLHLRSKGLELVRVRIRAGTKPLIDLSKSDLARLRAEISPESRVVWTISEDGFSPAPYDR